MPTVETPTRAGLAPASATSRQTSGVTLTCALVAFFGASPVPAAPPDPYSHAAIAAKDYHGVVLKVVSVEKPVLGEPVALHARQFEELTGAKIDITFVPFNKLYQEVLQGLQRNKYDVLFYGSMWIADVLPYLEPIPGKMLESPQYRDVLPHYQTVASWGETPYQVPIDGDRHTLQYRRDLLEDPSSRAAFKRKTGRELTVPATWEELQEIARFFDHTKLAGGREITGMVEVTVSDALLGNQFITRAAPYAKHPGVKGGFYFDLETMEPLINTPGFVKALQGFVEAQDLYPSKGPETSGPGGWGRVQRESGGPLPKSGREMNFPDVIRSFGRGDAVFTVSWDDPFIQAMEPGSSIRNKVAVALAPGSRRVWNRRTGRWDEFPAVNYAPYVVYGWTSGVARSSRHKEAAFDFLGFYANQKNHTSDLLVGRFGMNPFRASDLNERFWVERAGWDEAVARSYVDTQRLTTASKNRVLDLRIHRGQEYLYILSVGVYRALTGRESPQSALDTVAKRWRQLTERVGVEKQRAAYRHVVRFEDAQ
jgi:multiple sugar transport system substrate-binding protein